MKEDTVRALNSREMVEDAKKDFVASKTLFALSDASTNPANIHPINNTFLNYIF
ncbi:MAG: hypothetical protein QXX95_03295 [Nitrososphaerales archaeon]